MLLSTQHRTVQYNKFSGAIHGFVYDDVSSMCTMRIPKDGIARPLRAFQYGVVFHPNHAVPHVHVKRSAVLKIGTLSDRSFEYWDINFTDTERYTQRFEWKGLVHAVYGVTPYWCAPCFSIPFRERGKTYPSTAKITCMVCAVHPRT